MNGKMQAFNQTTASQTTTRRLRIILASLQFKKKQVEVLTELDEKIKHFVL